MPALYPGAGVVTSRGDVHWVVTEWGAANLHGKTVRERALALVHIAHPDFREKLMDEAHRRQGVFAALYRHVHQLAMDTPGVCGLRLYVEKENIAAQRTYESLGMVDARYCMYEASMPWLSKVIG